MDEQTTYLYTLSPDHQTIKDQGIITALNEF